MKLNVFVQKKLHNSIETTRNSSEVWKNVNRRELGGMNKQVENTEKLTTGLQHVVTGATADSVLLAISLWFLL